MDEIKFAVFTDLHYDHIPDGGRRLQEFVNKVRGMEFPLSLLYHQFAYKERF
ncbi:MAG: hypothetical protein Q8930_19440 [Bacillota bacterium]|nr:hypothetical protein [Bacillota bacterium]